MTAHVHTEDPWIDEATGYPCVARLVQTYPPGWWCGYIVLPAEHPWHDLDDHEEGYIDVHGGITFSQPMGPYWLLGFDCNHAEDMRDPKSIGFVRLELAKLAQQAHAAYSLPRRFLLDAVVQLLGAP